MSNRLEQEFPETSWRVVPPVGPRGLERDVVRHYIARGHKLRSQAARRGLRAAAAGTRRAVAALGAFFAAPRVRLAGNRTSTTAGRGPLTALDPKRLADLFWPKNTVRNDRVGP